MNKIRIAGAAAGVVLVSGMVLQVSSAAFTDTTDNAGNSWAAGSVYLSDSQNGTAMFSSASAKIVPGYTDEKCMTVKYDGTVDPAGAIKLAGDVTSNTFDSTGDGLADDIDVVIEMGPDGSTCLNGDIVSGAGDLLGLVGGGTTQVHAGTLDSIETAGPANTWTPDGDAAANATSRTRTFKFTVSMPGDTPNDAQGDAAAATFIWSSTAGTS